MDRLNNKKSLSNSWIVSILLVALIAAAVLSFMLGRYPITPKELVETILGMHAGDTMEKVVFNVRLPRIVIACLVGCCLSAAGAAYQGVFQNPMAAPDILGASSGAALGAALALLLNCSTTIVVLAAFAFSLASVFLVIFVSGKAKGKKVLGLILSGIMISSLMTSGTSFIKLVADPTDQLPKITYWLMGSLAGIKKSELGFVVIPMALGCVPLVLMRWRINVLTLGDDEARTMGVNANRLRIIVIICSTLITAASVSVSGMIGWVGLVIPHLARRMVGNNYKHLMPATMLLGGIFMLVVDDIARNLLATEIPIGILTAFIGAPFFIYLITREGERY